MIMKKNLVRKESYTDLKLIAGNIGKLYEEGISFLDILELIQEMPLKKSYKLGMERVKEHLKGGKTFEESLREEEVIFPDLFISIVAIGEKTGRLSLVLKSLEKYYGKREMVKNNVFKALSYPLVLFIALMVVLGLLVFLVIPSIGEMYASLNKELPKSCIILMEFIEFIKKKPWVVILAIFSTIVFIKILLVLLKGKVNISNLLQKIPLVREFNEYLITILMSVVINSGINISKGFNYCSQLKYVGSVNERLQEINKSLLQGDELSIAMNKSKLFSKYTLAHIKLGERSGSLDNRLELLESELYEKLIFRLNKNMERIQPCLIISMGGLVLIFISTFVLPLLDGFSISGI